MKGSEVRRPWLWGVIGCISGPLLALIFGILVVRTVFERYRITTRNMEPTLVKGDVVLVRPANNMRRGELIVFRPPNGDGVFVNRLIALPGEEVELRQNKAVVNGVVLDEPYIRVDQGLPDSMLFRDMPRVRIQEGSYFVLGDNRDHANDSRFIGPVARQAVRGRVVFVISPRSGFWRP